MMVQTSTLTGPALRWAVAECEGFAVRESFGPNWYLDYAPDLSWDQGGEIIRAKYISLNNRKGEPCSAFMGTPEHPEHRQWAPEGQPLVAAMRCYVASIKGQEVNLPKEIEL